MHMASDHKDAKGLVVYDSHNETLHPLFNSNDGDVILAAKNQTLFRLHSYTLKTTSGWFRSLFSLPHMSATTPAPEIIHLDEDVYTLECLLRMICGLPVLPFRSYDDVDTILFAAEKYDMPGPISVIRMLIMTPPLLGQSLRLYAIATHFGWEEEAKLASSQTLILNIHAAEHRASLRRLDTEAVLNIFQLHRERREGLRARLDQAPFVGDSNAFCSSCRRSIDHHTWRELKHKVIMEMDVRPLGDTILSHGLLEWPEAGICWEAKCPYVECSRLLYDKVETQRLIRECVDGLRQTI